MWLISIFLSNGTDPFYHRGGLPLKVLWKGFDKI